MPPKLDIIGLFLNLFPRYRSLVLENERLHTLARTDALTSLPNRGAFVGAHDAAYAHAIRAVRASDRRRWRYCVAIIDVDFFKRVNDLYGHHTGDLVLQSLASVFMENKRTEDMVARFGGEEFAILMPDTGIVGGCALAERIRQDVSEKGVQDVQGVRLAVTISVGVAEWEIEETTSELLVRADQALYRAKHKGRNRVERG